MPQPIDPFDRLEVVAQNLADDHYPRLADTVRAVIKELRPVLPSLRTEVVQLKEQWRDNCERWRIAEQRMMHQVEENQRLRARVAQLEKALQHAHKALTGSFGEYPNDELGAEIAAALSDKPASCGLEHGNLCTPSDGLCPDCPDVAPENAPVENQPIGHCKHCGTPVYSTEGFCGICRR